MIIRKEQVDAMLAAQQQTYARRLRSFFRRTIPETAASFSEPVLLELITEGLDKARRYGVETGPGVKRFIGLMLLVSPKFDEIPAVKRFLCLPDLDPDFRIKVLSDMLSHKLREQDS